MEELLEKPELFAGQERQGKERQASGGTGPSFREWARIMSRRVGHLCHNLFAGHRLTGPVSFLMVSAALGLAMTLTTLYTPSFAVIVDGENLGVVADQSTVETVVDIVEQRGSDLLGYDYTVGSDISYEFALTLRTDLTEQTVFEDYFFGQLEQVGEDLRKFQVLVDGQVIGIVDDEQALYELLASLKSGYINENTTSSSFVEDVSVHYVYQADELMDLEDLRAILTENTAGETTYTVVKGDTFNAIAYRNDMSVSDLQQLNPSVDIDKLMIGDVLNIKEIVPRLSVKTTEHVIYTEAIPCPVVEVQDSTMYVGTTKIVTQGTEGLAEVTADVDYINGKEVERTILNSTTLTEATATTKAVGTKPKPKTASKGYYIWPCSGSITSYFGYRNIFGSTSYHSGIDIAAAKGTSIKAADGGKVTFAGYKGNYGYLVIITHDNGTQTYYGHCSSLLVSAGQRVYQGQVIARVGSTGRSTGNHCHFEIRIRGTAVNPLNYLR